MILPGCRVIAENCLLIAAIFLGVCTAPMLLAANTPSYVTRVWQTGDGLPMNSVTAVLQTRDGYLWLGTHGGLARFDGVSFTVFDGGNPSNPGSPHVTSLFEADDGALWIGHQDGAVTRYQSGKFSTVSVPSGWRGGKIFAIHSDREGDIWLVNQDAELVRVRDGFVIAAPSTNVTRLVGLAANPNGGFWIQRGNEVAAMEDGQLKPLRLTESGNVPYVQGIGVSRAGGLWLALDGRIRRWNAGHLVADLGAAPWDYAPVPNLIETKDGHLVIGTSDHGAYLVFPGREILRFCRTNGFSSDWITSLCEDREGNLWIGTGNGGLALLRTENLTVINPPDQWLGRAVLSVAAGAAGSLWIGTEGAGLYLYRAGVWTNFQTAGGIKNYYLWSVLEDAHGTAWAGSWGGSLFMREGDHFIIAPGLEDFSAPIPALLAARNGSLLVGSGGGLLRYQSGKWNWLARKPELISPDVRAIVEAPDGTVWFGMSGGGLGCLKDGKLRQFLHADGLASDYVLCLQLETNGALWIGTYNGLSRFQDGRFTSVTRNQGLPNNVICDLRDDGLGNFWISSHAGIARVNRAELNRCADDPSHPAHFFTYGLSDGMPSLECSGGFQPASCQTEDGRLWFPTSKGLVALDPKNVRTNPLPPPVVIERLLVDEALLVENPQSETPLKIAPGRQRFEFQFTGLSFAAPEKVRFKYRLEGLETEWVEVQSPRRAYYGHLPPGDYTFHVIACNNDEVWNEAGARLSFTTLPFFWQTWWFRILGGVLTAIAGGGIVWLDARRRMHRKLERLEREQAVERERSRIARDIHDDLGAGLTRISLLSESVATEESGSPKATKALDRIFTTTRELTQAMDEIVWAVNPEHDTLDSLATYLGKFAQDFLESAGVRCRLDVPMQLPDWRLDAEVRHNVFLAYKESLNNVARHAAANEVRVSLATTAREFTIVVEDSGRGFALPNVAAAPAPPSVRNGLTNMRQRLAHLGGHCKITSAPGRGTRVEFCVPVRSRTG